MELLGGKEQRIRWRLEKKEEEKNEKEEDRQ